MQNKLTIVIVFKKVICSLLVLYVILNLNPNFWVDPRSIRDHGRLIIRCIPKILVHDSPVISIMRHAQNYLLDQILEDVLSLIFMRIKNAVWSRCLDEYVLYAVLVNIGYTQSWNTQKFYSKKNSSTPWKKTIYRSWNFEYISWDALNPLLYLKYVANLWWEAYIVRIFERTLFSNIWRRNIGHRTPLLNNFGALEKPSKFSLTDAKMMSKCK